MDKERWTLSSLESQNSTEKHSFLYKIKLFIANLRDRFLGHGTTLKLVIVLVAVLGIGGFIFSRKFINKPQQISLQPTATPDTSTPIPDFTPDNSPIDTPSNSTLGVSTSVKATSTPSPSPSTTPTPTPTATPSPTPTPTDTPSATPSPLPSPSQSPDASASASPT